MDIMQFVIYKCILDDTQEDGYRIQLMHCYKHLCNAKTRLQIMSRGAALYMSKNTVFLSLEKKN